MYFTDVFVCFTVSVCVGVCIHIVFVAMSICGNELFTVHLENIHSTSLFLHFVMLQAYSKIIHTIHHADQVKKKFVSFRFIYLYK